ncbi:MAG: hypothetical protein Q9181_005291 [Wetmoreana brouardii]
MTKAYISSKPRSMATETQDVLQVHMNALSSWMEGARFVDDRGYKRYKVFHSQLYTMFALLLDAGSDITKRTSLSRVDGELLSTRSSTQTDTVDSAAPATKSPARGAVECLTGGGGISYE